MFEEQQQKKWEEKIKVKFMKEREKGTKIENLWKLFE